MAGYIGATPVPQATQHRKSFTATAGQTSFATGGYTPDFIDVYLNGVKLAAADFTATNGSDVVLASGATVGDILETISFTAFEIASQTFSGTTTVDDLSVAGNATFGDNNKAIFGAGSDLTISHDTTGTVGSYITEAGTGSLHIRGQNIIFANADGSEEYGKFFNGAGVEFNYADITKLATTSTGVDITGKLEVSANNNGGAKANYVRITDTDTTATAGNQQGGIEFFTNDATPGIAASIEVLYAGSGGGGELTFNTNVNSQGTLTEAMRIDSSGAITKPSQPAFGAINNTAGQNNLAINTHNTIVFGGEFFDQGSDFASNTFSTPVTGKYQFNVQIRLYQVDTAATYYQVRLTTSNGSYEVGLNSPKFTTDPEYITFTGSFLVDMDAADTAYVTVYQAGGSAQTDLQQSTSTFSGYLVA